MENKSTQAMKKEKEIPKIFNDPVHGHIEMPPLLVKIIDTPEFQRLRDIKQLGGGYYVFPGASHNRFEHSIGVAHLAGKLVQRLRTQEDLGITDKDELCVQIAGLCHDLGHGPFSHTFEAFMKEKKEFKHEEASVRMFNNLIDANDIRAVMEREYGFNDDDFNFIEKLIHDCPSKKNTEWHFTGRPKEKSYLYEIVANHRTGIDVDKMDYFSRDCHHLGMKCNFSHERYMMFARVCTNEKGEKQICVRDKEAMNMYELFHTRNLLHHNAYHHRVIKAVELMIVDALKAADDHFTLEGKKISAAVPDAESNFKTYVKLTDDILQQILRTSNEELIAAQERAADKKLSLEEKLSLEKKLLTTQSIIERILNRDLYKFVGEQIFKEVKHLDSAEKWKNRLKAWLENVKKEPSCQQLALTPDDFIVLPINLNYGMKEKNPVDFLRFYRKDDPDTAIALPKDEVSFLLPENFAETKVMLFYKGLPKKHVKKLWEELLNTEEPQTPGSNEKGAPSSAAADDDKIYTNLTDDILQKCLQSSNELSTSQKIVNEISQNGLYKFFDEKIFKPQEVEHLNNDDGKWKAKLNSWLANVKKQPDGQQPNLTVKDFKMVSYTLPDQPDFINIMLFYKGIPKTEIQKFWDEVRKVPGDQQEAPLSKKPK